MTGPDSSPLRARDLAADPLVEFEAWYRDAGVGHPQTVALATATAAGRPSARMVVCRGFGPEGFLFLTDRRSRKARELEANPRGALVFHWTARQVRVEGPVVSVEDAVADADWHRRALDSRLSVLASHQSTAVASREVLERRVAALRRERGDDPPRPDHWGAYRLVPAVFEFWQEAADRLHDRFRYTPVEDGWRRERLAP